MARTTNRLDLGGYGFEVTREDGVLVELVDFHSGWTGNAGEQRNVRSFDPVTGLVDWSPFVAPDATVFTRNTTVLQDEGGLSWDWAETGKLVQLLDGDRTINPYRSLIRDDGQAVVTVWETRDGPSKVVASDPLDVAGWSMRQTELDADGAVLRKLTVQDDDRLVQTTYRDPAEAPGQRAHVIEFDIGDAHGWATSERVWAEDGSLARHDVRQDDGRLVTTIYADGRVTQKTVTDAADTFDWAVKEHRWDAAGALVSTEVEQDDGRVVTTAFAEGRVTGTVVLDGADAFVWAKIERDRDPDGALTRKVVTYDDGRVAETAYLDGVRATQTIEDVQDRHDWARIERAWDAGGTLISEDRIMDAPEPAYDLV